MYLQHTFILSNVWVKSNNIGHVMVTGVTGNAIQVHYFAVAEVNYGISNTIVLEIP